MLDHHIAIARFLKASSYEGQIPVPVYELLSAVHSLTVFDYREHAHPYSISLKQMPNRWLITVYGANRRPMTPALTRFCMARVYARSLVETDRDFWKIGPQPLELNTRWPVDIFSFRFACDLVLPLQALTEFSRTPEFAQSSQPLQLIADHFDVPYALAVRQGQRLVQKKLLQAAGGC